MPGLSFIGMNAACVVMAIYWNIHIPAAFILQSSGSATEKYDGN